MRSKMMTVLIVLLCIFILIGIGLIVYMLCNRDALQSELLQNKIGACVLPIIRIGDVAIPFGLK